MRRARRGVMAPPQRRARGDASTGRARRRRRSPTTSTAQKRPSSATSPPSTLTLRKEMAWHPRVERRNTSRHACARGIRRRILTLTVAAVVLYGVAPAVLEVLGAYRRLTDVDPAWWIAVVATSAAGIWCMCALQRLALNGPRWFPVITSQLAGAAFSKVVPGGSAAAAALQARMLTQAGLPPAAVATGLTAGRTAAPRSAGRTAAVGAPRGGVRSTNTRWFAAGRRSRAGRVRRAVRTRRLASEERSRAQGGWTRTARGREEIASWPSALRWTPRTTVPRARSASKGARRRMGPGRSPGRWALDLRLSVALRRAPRSRRAAAAVHRADRLLGRATTRPAPAHSRRARRRRGRAHRDTGARRRPRGASSPGHARLPPRVVLALAADRPHRLDLAPATRRRRSTPAACVALSPPQLRRLIQADVVIRQRSRSALVTRRSRSSAPGRLEWPLCARTQRTRGRSKLSPPPPSRGGASCRRPSRTTSRPRARRRCAVG